MQTQEMYESQLEGAVRKAEREKAREMAQSLRDSGVSAEIIARASGLSEEEIKSL